jgi:hypothetical protein
MDTQFRITLTDNCNHYATQINNDLVAAIGTKVNSTSFDSIKDLSTVKAQLLELKVKSVCAISAINTTDRPTALKLVKALMDNNNNEEAFIILIEKESPTIQSNLPLELGFYIVDVLETPTCHVYATLNKTVQCRVLLDEFDRYKRSDENYMTSPFRERIIEALDIYNPSISDDYIKGIINTAHALGARDLIDIEFIRDAAHNELSINQAVELYFSTNGYNVVDLTPLKGSRDKLKIELEKFDGPEIALTNKIYDGLDTDVHYYKTSGDRVVSIYPSVAHNTSDTTTLYLLNKAESKKIIEANEL